MAKIDIFPLSVDGVKLPGNFLDNLLTQNDTSRLLYPLDLVNNPVYAHAIQFTVYDYEYPNLESAVNNVKDSISSSYAGSLNENGLFSVQRAVNAAKSANPANLGVLADFITPRNYVPNRSKALANISLYLPDTLSTSFDSDYTAVSLTETFGLPGVLATGYQAYKKSIDPNQKKEFFNTAAKGAASAILDERTRGLAGNVLKTVLNPQLQLVYRGIGLREFQFEFIFTPASKKEADSVEKIVKSFMYYSLPEKIMEGQFLIPPQLFTIKFIYTGGDTLTNTISDIFNKTLTNVLGSQLSGWLAGSNPTQSMSGKQNTKLFDIGDCVLSNVTVDYAPNGWASYHDGQPVQTRLTLQFKEMNMRSKVDMENAGFIGPYVTGETFWNNISNNIQNIQDTLLNNSNNFIGPIRPGDRL